MCIFHTCAQKYQFVSEEKFILYRKMKIALNVTYRLTLLWAFVESGLGGLLHGLRLPVTGFILGGFSVIIICLLAQYSSQPFKDIIQSTLLVMAIKFTVSPHSPLPAYVAVAFQGFTGAALLSTMKVNRVTILAFAILAMVESAIQRPVMATLIFGSELWRAIDDAVEKLLVAIGMPTAANVSIWIIGAYVVLHMLWALVVANWVYRLPQQLKEFSTAEIPEPALTPLNTMSIGKKKSSRFIVIVLLVFSVVCLITYWYDQQGKWIYLLRTITIILVLYFVVGPLLRFALRKLSTHKSAIIHDYIVKLPTAESTVKRAWAKASKESSLLKKLSVLLSGSVYIMLTQDDAS